MCVRVCGVLVGARVFVCVCAGVLVCMFDGCWHVHGNRVHLQHAGTDLQGHRDTVDTKNSVVHTQRRALSISELTTYFSWIRHPLHTRNSLAQTSMGTHLNVGACRHANFKRHAMITAETGGETQEPQNFFQPPFDYSPIRIHK